jgi:hypothetical protein
MMKTRIQHSIKVITKTAFAVVLNLFVISLLLFSALEFFPSLFDYINLEKIPYYAQKNLYVYDNKLVFRPRKVQHTSHKDKWAAGSDNPAWGVEPKYTTYHASYNRLGFRTNSSSNPFDVVVIGDSYVEIGESDENTLSEQIKKYSGLKTFNLGRSWYGPHQYIEVFKRYGLPLKPKTALICYFTGNDIQDVAMYRRWFDGGRYYSFALDRKNFFQRYLIATWQSLSHVWKSWLVGDYSTETSKPKAEYRLKVNSGATGNINPYLGMIRSGNNVKTKLTFNFRYGDLPLSVEMLEADREWKILKDILIEFKRLCQENRIRPVLVFIPSKIQIYKDYLTAESGVQVRQFKHHQDRYHLNSEKAFLSLSRELNLEVIDLVPHFQLLARQGKLLYYPFNNHWNTYGIEQAGKIIGHYLKVD